MNTPAGKQRIDKWLWFVRCVKTRTLAQKLVNGGHVKINKERCSDCAHKVKVGDVLTVTLPRQIKIYRVVELGEKRGSATQAAELYEDLSPPPLPKSDGPRPLPQAVREKGAGRPTKKERRQTETLLGKEPL
ncbi:RNA-binding S4 domain-containing protein [Maritalea sp. S77]|uniref:RNA-binding S4 domain-containing protein n=1 Tax=Maritalea sp. S77 TaxID=3415125 RepID=UPI003C7D5FA8